MNNLATKNLRRSNVRTSKALRQIQTHLPSFIVSTVVTPTFNVVHTFPAAIRGVGYYRRNYPTIRASVLTDLIVYDNVTEPNRFTRKYRLYSSRFNARFRRIFYGSEYRAIPSRRTPFKDYQAIFASADWLEREAWDLYGVYFAENRELRRRLTDYGFKGHALRKDYPRSGFFEIAYDPSVGHTYIVGAELNQELREYREFQL